MIELIIIKTIESKKVKGFLQQENINYEIYQEPKKEREIQEKKALWEWQNLSDEELIVEWEKLPDNGRENN